MRANGDTATSGDLTIGELARRAGVRTSALRFYEDVGVLPVARRVSGQRRYAPDALQRVAVVQVAQEAGFTLAEIRLLLHGFSARSSPSARWRTLAERKLPAIEELIVRARGMKRILEEGLRCGCLELDACALVGARTRSLRSEKGAPPMPHRMGAPSTRRIGAPRVRARA